MMSNQLNLLPDGPEIDKNGLGSHVREIPDRIKAHEIADERHH